MRSHTEPDRSTPDLPRLVSVEQLASAWGLKPATIRAWARRRKLPAFKLAGELWAFRVDDLNEYLEERMRQGQ